MFLQLEFKSLIIGPDVVSKRTEGLVLRVTVLKLFGEHSLCYIVFV